MKILITGGTGMIGSAFRNIETEHELISIGSRDYDLTDSSSARYAIVDSKPDAIIHLAAKVGGVGANIKNPGDFYTINSLINTNVLKAAKDLKVGKVISLLSTCVYPDMSVYPLTEDQVHKGPPHPSNYAYAYAKRMLDVQTRAYCDQYGCNYTTAIPNNLFGENDNFHLEDSHVIPAIIRKMFEARVVGRDVVLWGDGSRYREFTYSKDLAEILLFLLEHYDRPDPINVGNTRQVTIKEVAELIADILNFEGNIIWDKTKPQGQLKKPSDNSKLLELGWREQNYTNFKKALTKTCEWVTLNYPNIRGVK